MPYDLPLPEQVADQVTYGSGYLQPDYTSISDGLVDVSIPTLTLVALQDIILAPANSQLLLKQIPDARMLTYAGAGHVARPEAAAMFSSFLDTLPI